MDLDEQDLYPPDVEDLTPEVREHRKRVAIGTALVVWGAGLLVERALGVDLETFWLGLGLAAIAGWTQVPQFNWFVAGSIMSGIGVGSLLSGPLDNGFGAAVSNLCIGAGFAAIYVRYPRRSSWAIAVAGVFALIAVGAFGIGLIGLVPASLGRFLLPLLLIGGGVLLLLRHSLPPKAVKLGLAVLAVSFVVVGATSVPDIDDPISIDPGPTLPVQPLGLAPGQTLVMDGGGSGDIEFVAGDIPSIEVRGRRDTVLLRNEGDRVIVGRTGMFGNDSSVDYVVTLPPGVIVDVVRESGKVTGRLAGVRGNIRTSSGDVMLELVDGGAEGPVDDGPIDIVTGSGNVKIESRMLLDLSLASEDDVIVNQANENGRYRSPAGVIGVEVDIDSQSGDIEIDMPQLDVPAAPIAPTAPTAPSSPVPPGGD